MIAWLWWVTASCLLGVLCLIAAASYFHGRTDVQCLHRWQKVLNPQLIKGGWTKEVGGHRAAFADSMCIVRLSTVFSIPYQCNPCLPVLPLTAGGYTNHLFGGAAWCQEMVVDRLIPAWQDRKAVQGEVGCRLMVYLIALVIAPKTPAL